MIYPRIVQPKIQNWIGKGKIIIIYGARQVGKTTLVENILNEYNLPKTSVKYIDCDLIANRLALQSQDKNLLTEFIGKHKIVVIDEAQRVENIGLNLKILHKYLPDTQIIATGSSSFDLANKINEPLTGRNVEFKLYPLSLAEIKTQTDIVVLGGKIENMLRFGMYPDIYGKEESEGITLLDKLANDYLFRDLLEYGDIRKSGSIYNLLKVLAFCVGSEISFTEIGSKVGLNKNTTEKYIDLLEKCFIIFTLKPYKRKLIKEITKPQKVYFWDLGIRNSIIQNYKPMAMRDDVGAIWENFCIAEMLKKSNNELSQTNYYFWRTTDQQEIDLIQESNGQLKAFEIKHSPKKQVTIPKIFDKTYPDTSFEAINNQNWWQFLI